MDFIYVHDNKEYAVTITPEKDGYIVSSGSRQCRVSADKLKQNFYSVCLDDEKRYKVVVSRKKERYHVFINGEIYQLTRSRGRKRTTDEDDQGDLNSPITGKVVKLLVEVGDSVEKGQEIMVLEAMKMEYTIIAPHTGVIEKINFQEGKPVEMGNELGVIREQDKDV